MRQVSSEAWVCVTVEYADCYQLVWWHGKSVAAVRKAAKKAYPGARLKLGRALWRNSYGAH